MSHVEEGLLRRFSGARILGGSAVLGTAGVLPLLLYVWLGPADGNPVGLGLLAVASAPLAACGMLLGAVKLLAARFRRRDE